MRVLSLLALFSVACAVPPVNGTPQEALRVEGDLAFGGVYVRASRDRSITVSNPGRASRSVEVQLGAPFAAIERFTVASGDAVQLQVTFTPTAPGPSRGQPHHRPDRGRGDRRGPRAARVRATRPVLGRTVRPVGRRVRGDAAT
ncbi:MAG: hypothetical protein DI536_09655 [Archangium gephyra]|uniref:Abnormal spindle-like microcephaly-associated protein ASH domain-containing protein n=1 Tax=Archangium gephyra TaxID=48 RepID=A0A2W5TJS3_9BACT|nr:MAG: hypothetical protein DI536_09655 [Archangium gephyra]